MRIDGKVVLITGAGSGIGRALAIEAARRGARLILVGRRVAALEQTRGLLDRAGIAAVLDGDITLGETRRKLRERILAAWGRLDILVNNAGAISAGPFAALSDLDIERLFAINLIAPVALTRELLPALAASGAGRIVNVGSMFGDIGYPFFTAYGASKFGLRGFSLALRRELRAAGITVTYAAPRGTLTGATEAFGDLLRQMDMKLEDAETVAAIVWDAVARDAQSCYPRGRELLHLMAQRLFPGLVDRAVARQLEAKGLLPRLAGAMPWAFRQIPPARRPHAAGIGDPLRESD